MGAPVHIKIAEEIIDPVRIATDEFEKGVIPISVNRRNKVRFKWE
jgi:DNA-directed RNA polymerase subunit K/omega